jgi:type IV pilus assembly protein PilV
MIEALIAFAILSIGLLGIVRLQGVAKTSQHTAIEHTRAVTYADAIVERIRINPAGMTVYDLGLDDPVGGASRGSEPSPNCKTADCTADQLAAHDLWAWEQALDGAVATVDGENTAGLIEPQACIVFTPTPGRTRTGLLTVIIQWRGLQESFDAVQGGEVVCGEDGEDAGTDPYRRQLVSNTYIIDETDI